MKRLFLLIFFNSIYLLSFAQKATGIPHTFNITTDTIGFQTTSTGLINVLTTLIDDQNYFINPGPNAFSFTFGGVTYNKVVISTNGFLALIPSTYTGATPPPPFDLNSFPTNSLSNNTSGYPIIAPLWDNHSTNIISYTISSNILRVRWTSRWSTGNTASITYSLLMNGNTNTIRFYYSTSTYTPLNPSASIGIAGICQGDFYSVNVASATTATVDSVNENQSIGQGTPNNFRPSLVSYNWTPYARYNTCAAAYDYGTINSVCRLDTLSNVNNTSSGLPGVCSTTDVNDVWVKFVKPIGFSAIRVTTAPAPGSCMVGSGTSVEVYSSCGGTLLGCGVTGLFPGYGQVSISNRPECVAETLYARITVNGDAVSKFRICAQTIAATTGTTCSNATNICSLPFSNTGMSTSGFGNDYDSLSACQDQYMNGEDYVYSYTPATNQCVNITLNSNGNNPAVFLIQGCPSSGTAGCIATGYGNAADVATIVSASLTAGQTYYVIVDNYPILNSTASIPFDISITNSTASSQAYDDCGQSVNLGTIGSGVSCTYSTYTTECSRPSPAAGYPNPGCGGLVNGLTGDVWLRFTAGAAGTYLITTRPSSSNATTDAAMAIYAGSCGAFTLVSCDDNSAGSGMPQLSFTATLNTTYWIRMWTVSPANPGNFDICVSSSCTPANDLPCNAFSVPIGGVGSGNNTCATAASEPTNAAQCVIGGSINTVWYKTVVPASGTLKVRTNPMTLIDTQIQLYRLTGACTNVASFVNLGCNDDGANCGSQSTTQSFYKFSEISLTGLTAGETIYIAVDGKGSTTGTFEISVIEGNGSYPPAYLQDCSYPYEVCSNSNIVLPDPGVLNYGNICDFANNYGCFLNPERNSSWWRVNVNPGTFQFVVNSVTDYDFIMWDITGVSNACAAINAQTIPPIRCNWVTTTGQTGVVNGQTGTGFDPLQGIVSATPRTYMLLINNWNPTTFQTGFTLDWLGSPIANNPSSVIWTGATDTLASTANNWGVSPCNRLPDCGIDAVVVSSPSGRQPTLSGTMDVNDFRINGGASFRMKAGSVLNVCGSFSNFGTFIAEPGSTVVFKGTGTQNITGTLTGTNAFANVTVNKTAGSVVLATNADIAGNFTTSTATSIFNINGKYLKIGGNFSNFNANTTFTGTGGSTVEFYGTTNQFYQNINGSLFLNRVRMNKMGKLYLSGSNSSLNVDSILTLSNGFIVTRSLSTLEVYTKWSNVNAVIGNSSASFIDGKIRRALYTLSNGTSIGTAGDVEFPVGDSLGPVNSMRYELAAVRFTISTVVNDVSVWFNAWPAATPPDGPAANECLYATYALAPLLNHGYWTFDKLNSGFFNGVYNLKLYSTGATNVVGQGFSIVTANKTADPMLSSSWSTMANCVLTSTLATSLRNGYNSPTANALTFFNHLYAVGQSLSPLPIELLYFNAIRHNTYNECRWETSSETNNDYFIIERSEDGQDFLPIGRQTGYGAGTYTQNRRYSFIDTDPCNSIQYYRLKQVDIDGNFSYSNVSAVNCNSFNDNDLQIYPNPGSTEVYLAFDIKINSDVKIEWTDMTGRILKEHSFSAEQGFNLNSMDISNLPKGIYNVRLIPSGNDIIHNARFVKE